MSFLGNLFAKKDGTIGGRSTSLEGATSALVFLIVTCTCLAFALVLAMVKINSQHETTVLVPPQLNHTVTVGWNSADKDYIESWGLYVAVLAGNITSKNAKFVVDKLSLIVSPRIYSDVRIKLLAQAEDENFMKNATARRFIADKIISETDFNRVFVTGTMVTDTLGTTGQGEPWTFEMVIYIEGGKPVVDAINNYAGAEPHNEQWLKNHEGDAQPITGSHKP